MRAKKILLVEDNPFDAELTVRALGAHLANEVVTVGDGLAALQYLRRTDAFAQRPEGNPVLVLLDLRLPKLDGLDVLREMRADPTLQSLRVVVLTGSQQAPDLSEANRLGVAAYIVKPVELDNFMKVVGDVGLRWVVKESA